MHVNLASAKAMIEAAEQHALAKGSPVTIAVVDEGGNLVAQHRMDGACLATIELSKKKAHTALVMFEATHSLVPKCQTGQPLFGIHTAFGDRLAILAGGLPIRFVGSFIGGVGVSGASDEIDVACCRAALAAFGADEVP